MPLPVVHHPDYVAPMPAGHRFPMGKFGRVMAVLLEDAVVAPAQIARPEPAPRAWIELAHTADYVTGVTEQRLDAEAVRRIGLPQSPEVARRARAATGGTVLTARLALAHGLACNTAGGSHHAQAGFGAGFCVFNDVAVAARVLLAEGAVDRILVVDLDVHQGDGTAAIFRLDPTVFTFSVHSQSNYPVRKQQSDLDVGLDDGLEDDAYLRVLADHLPDLLSMVRPDLVFYNAGVDPHRDDRLGRLMLTSEGLARRDAYVLATCIKAGVPVAGVLGGGYGRDVDEVARRHAILHRVAGDLFGPLRL